MTTTERIAALVSMLERVTDELEEVYDGEGVTRPDAVKAARELIAAEQGQLQGQGQDK